ncbi:prepilin-type N-terminal cleavage/methylation domain-containing protein [Actinoplanes sp. NPDC049596]|uniref:prepilin-type N-terminal cleavage/methylation domain-containing protein n=1 Tax=unclassified Actinoplanes TaxID=2626549 RepID=UPI0034191733
MKDDHNDGGYSLIELMVAMGIMSVVLVIVLGGLTEVYSDVNRTDTLANARDQLGNSFRRLDKELRYANWLSTPGQVGGAWYLEYAVPGTPAIPATSTRAASPARPAGCRQLVYRNGVLTLASWTLPGVTPGTPTTIATDLALTGSTPPFTVYLANSLPYASASPGTSGVGADYQVAHSQVRLQFTGSVGRTTLPFDVLFTAQNTNGANVFSENGKLTDNDCGKGRPGS